MSMEALVIRLGLILTVMTTAGATYRTPNFIVTAPTAEIAKQCGDAAEHFREELAMKWLGKKMPRWYKPCTLSVKVGQIGAGGATTFAFDRGEVFGWRMNVQGTLERILDSVIPHEVSHTVLACHFRRPLPRWADEGAATLVEHESEQRRQRLLLEQVWDSSRRIPLRRLLAIKEYPKDMQDVLTLYAEGYSLADFLVQAGGRTRFLEFLDAAHRIGWDAAIKQYYNLDDVNSLENRWNGWIMAGSPRLNLPPDTKLASNEQPAGRENQPIIRGQSPDNAAPKMTPNRPQPTGNAPIISLPPTQPKTAPARTVARPRDAVTKDSPGWRRAVNEGWTPAGQPNEPAANTPPPFETNNTPKFDANDAERAAAGGRLPNWSGFPRNPGSEKSERLSQAFASPSSP
ncbi:hypothetical protein [Thalassoroseus pseudoceratinae]|uniref:hypothetical protein n=1 Tax=Thalassoroseus pseudoceratinae TaxID=2713176 RepID=UPI00141DC175|nr:hypothetical protein [Thalassoroseus pseudoceratinae]